MASKNIAFEQIGASNRKPGKYAEFNTKLAVRTLPGNLQKTLVIGQRTAAGTVQAGVVTDVFSDDQAATYFGRGSQAHRMVLAALRANRYLSLQVLPLDDAGAGIAATCTVTITGPATSTGVLTVKVGDDLVQIPIAAGDAQNAIATALKAQLDAQPDLPVSAGLAANVVTMTVRNKGTCGNGIKVSASVTATGVVATATAMSGGATDPTLSTALALIFTAGHNVLISPYIDTTGLASLRDHLDNCGNGIEKRGAVAAVGYTGTLSAATTAMLACNPKRISGALVPATTTPAYEVAAAYGAVIAFEEDPALPLNTLALPGVSAPPLSSQLSRSEQENCLYNGVTPTEVGPGDVVQIVRAITGYTKDAQGVADIALLDLTTVRSLDYGRKALVERLSLRFPRSKKSERVKKQVREELLDVMYKLEDLEIWEHIAENEDGVLVEDDLQDPNRLDVRIPADVVNGLHVLAMRIDLLL